MALKKPKKKKGRGRYGITSANFVEIWQMSNSVDDVIKATGMPRAAVYSRVNTYRGKKVALKKMPRRKQGIDVDALNAIIEKVTPTKKKEKS